MRASNKLHEWKCGCELMGPVSVQFDRISRDMLEGFKEIKTSMGEITDSQKFLALQYDEIKKSLDEIKDLKLKVLTLEQKLTEKDKEVNMLKKQMTHVEQYSRRNMIEIREVHQQKDEKVERVVVKVAQKFDVPLTEEDIEVAHRLKAAPGKKPAIIVELNSRKKRNLFLESRKKVVTNQDVLREGEGRIYLSESLSPFYRELLWKTRKIAKEDDYRFCWYQNEKILLRKENSSTIIVIHDEEDLAKLPTTK